ncbi:hypothetical protein ACFXTH_026471 [Malus domestica]
MTEPFVCGRSIFSQQWESEASTAVGKPVQFFLWRSKFKENATFLTFPTVKCRYTFVQGNLFTKLTQFY